MGSVIDLFPDKPTTDKSDVHTISKLDFWKGRNEIISRDFHTFSVFQKQEALDTVFGTSEKVHLSVPNANGKFVKSMTIYWRKKSE